MPLEDEQPITQEELRAIFMPVVDRLIERHGKKKAKEIFMKIMKEQGFQLTLMYAEDFN